MLSTFLWQLFKKLSNIAFVLTAFVTHSLDSKWDSSVSHQLHQLKNRLCGEEREICSDSEALLVFVDVLQLDQLLYGDVRELPHWGGGSYVDGGTWRRLLLGLHYFTPHLLAGSLLLEFEREDGDASCSLHECLLGLQYYILKGFLS